MFLSLNLMKKIHLITYFFLSSFSFLWAQYAQFKIEDALTNKEVLGAVVYVNNEKITADASLKYSYLAKEKNVLVIKHKNYKTFRQSYKGEIPEKIWIEPKVYALSGVEVISSSHKKSFSKVSEQVDAREIQRSAGRDLANTLSQISGVVAMKSGATISKPAIHGMSGQRILTLNAGINVESQQWGDEHGIEVDPILADEIEIVKGAAGLRYGMGGLSGVILVKPKSVFSYDRPISAEALLGYETNSKKYITALKVGGEFHSSGVSWQLQGSYANAGDYRTADYVVNNSGNRNKNFLAEVGWRNKQTTISLYANALQQDIATFYGVRVGNEEDLRAVITYGRPLLFSPWSRKIEAPKQEVFHQLYKAEVTHQWNQLWKSSLTLSYQQNHRQEYEVRRMDYTKIPALDLKLSAKTLDFSTQYHHHPWKVIAGIYANYKNNYSIPGTGVVPVIPNFVNRGMAAYGITQYRTSSLKLEGGVRYEYQYLNALGKYVTTQEYGGQHHFNALNIGVSGEYKINDNTTVTSDLGIAQRIPSVYELYSKGVSHGKPFYIEGNDKLKKEKSLKWITALSYKDNNWKAKASVYINPVQNYIYNKYSGENIQQWAGYFAVFDFTQSNVLLKGLDAEVSYTPISSLNIGLKYAGVIAKNTEDNNYLPQIPADRWMANFQWRLPTISPVMENTLNVNYTHTAKAKRYSPAYDVVPLVPEGYHLFDARIESSIKIKRHTIDIYAGVENIFNALYKDYTDTFRYFTHLPGRNIYLKTIIKF